MISAIPSTSVFNRLETIVNNNNQLSDIELINELRNIIKNHENEEKKKEKELQNILERKRMLL